MRTLITAVVVACTATLCGCNQEIFDTNLKYTRALVKWPDGTMKELKIHKWCDYEGEQIQIRATDGKVYLVSSLNAVLIRD